MDFCKLFVQTFVLVLSGFEQAIMIGGWKRPQTLEKAPKEENPGQFVQGWL